MSKGSITSIEGLMVTMGLSLFLGLSAYGYWLRGDQRDAALMNAAVKGNLQAARILLSQGANVNTVDKAGRSALLYAAQIGNGPMVTLFAASGADLHAKDAEGFEIGGVALIHMAGNGQVKAVKALVDKGVDLRKYGHFALIKTLKTPRPNPDVIRFLLESGVDVNGRNSHGSTALMEAAGRCRAGEAMMLLEEGADATIQTATGRTALTAAARCPDSRVVALILEKTAQAGGSQPDVDKALIEAAKVGNLAAVKLLLKEVSVVPAEAFSEATRAGRAEVLDALFDTAPTPRRAQALLKEAKHPKVIRVLQDRAGSPGKRTQPPSAVPGQ